MRLNNYLQLHLIILLWGFTPVLGKLISLQAYDLVWYRLFISGIGLYIYMKWKGVSINVSPKAMVEMLLLGVVVGFHWFAFYHAIKVSNVTVTMAAFSTITLFASLFQPLLLNKKFFWGDVIYGVVISAGLLIILHFEKFSAAGIFWGTIAAITSAFFGVYNGRLILKHDAMSITFIEFAGAFLFITAMNLFYDPVNTFVAIPGTGDLIALLILGIFCTTIAFTWSINILKKFTPLTVIITNNLEPVYGIVFSVLLFGQSEYMSREFYIGAGVILVSVFSYPFVQKRFGLT